MERLMKKNDWNKFKNNNEIIEHMKSLPRYKNTMIKSAYRRALFFLSLLYCRLFGLDKPLFIVLVTNNTCNLNCLYCYGNYGKRKQKDYSTKELLKIVDELKDLGTRLLTIHGGESLLRPDIGEIINYAKLKGFYISLNTNGYLIPKKIEELRCLDSIVVSLDGKEENNDRNRGAGSYKKAINAMDVISQNKIPLCVSATLTRDNLKDMEFLAKLGSAKNFRVQYSILYNHASLRAKCPNIGMSDKEIRETVSKINELRKSGYPIYYSENVLTTTIDWPVPHDKRYFTQKEDNFTKDYRLVKCYHGKLKYQIDADGRVITCWAHDNVQAPNIKKIGVAEAIKQCRDNKVCKYCSFLANNEHNALMHLSPRNIWNILSIHFADVLQIKKGD